jgi:hypothetical protein
MRPTGRADVVVMMAEERAAGELRYAPWWKTLPKP